MKTVSLLLALALAAAAQDRPRARDLGIKPGILPVGRWNAITDVPGVRVGHTTLMEGDSVRTGVTAILPHSGNPFQLKTTAAIYTGNGFGKLIGSTQVDELGVIETPIVLTNTLSVWRAAEAVADYVIRLPGNEDVRSVNPVVGETNDGGLNDIRGFHVTHEHVRQAITTAREGPVAEGSVGAGTGTQAFGFKGGIGTASRVYRDQTVGVLVQSNYGGILTIDGVPVGRELGRYLLKNETGDGSVMIVAGTDAALDARQLKRLARRAMLAVGRTGSPSTHGSGDYVIAFSTARGKAPISDEALTPLFQAIVEAAEEAIYNSMLRATTVKGRNQHVSEAIPVDRLQQLLRKYGH